MTKSFAELSLIWDRYSQQRTTNPAACYATGKELRTAFDEIAAANEQFLSIPESEQKASDARRFEQNLASLTTMQSWLKQIAADETPQRKGNPAYVPTQGKSYGGAKLAFGANDLAELHEAIKTRSFASKAITVTGVPQAASPEYASDVFPFLRDKPRLRELMPTKGTDRPSVIYFRGLTAASAAAAVAEGADKPESSPTWETVTVPMSKLAHYGSINDEVIDDYSAWLQFIGEEFLAGLIDAENDALINGSGVSPAMTGLLNASGIQTQAFSTNNIESLAKAGTKLRTGAAYTEPDTIIMNPANWEPIELFRVGGSTTTDGPYMVNPLTAPSLQLWGVPVVLTTRIAAGTAIVANLKAATEVYVRQDATFEVHPSGGGLAEWKANKTLVRAEERLALTVPRPKAVVKVTGLS